MSIYARRFHAVVANPPYIVPPTAAARDAYRARYVAAHAKFGMGAVFTERMFELLVPGGFVAQITANNFMKREFGKPLVERVLPHYELTHVIDTSGAYIPGHGTPTVILAARNRAPTSTHVRAVMSKRGEPETPKDQVGRVWNSIRRGLGLPEEVAPSGPQPIGLVWAKALAPVAKALARELRGDLAGMGGAELDRETETGATCAAAWLTTAAGLRVLDLYRAAYSAARSPDGQHLALSFAAASRALPFSGWFDPAGVNPCFSRMLTDAQSARVRRAVAEVVDPEAIPQEQSGRTDCVGDLYQGLDDAAREEHAFCQTPWFVARLLCELAVAPALREFGPGATVLDPACGTGHLLCEVFAGLARGRDPTAALGQVAGGDINPVAAAIAEWRLMLAWVDAARPRRLSAVPDDLPIRIEVADALTAERPVGRIDHAQAHVAPARPAESAAGWRLIPPGAEAPASAAEESLPPIGPDARAEVPAAEAASWLKPRAVRLLHVATGDMRHAEDPVAWMASRGWVAYPLRDGRRVFWRAAEAGARRSPLTDPFARTAFHERALDAWEEHLVANEWERAEPRDDGGRPMRAPSGKVYPLWSPKGVGSTPAIDVALARGGFSPAAELARGSARSASHGPLFGGSP